MHEISSCEDSNIIADTLFSALISMLFGFSFEETEERRFMEDKSVVFDFYEDLCYMRAFRLGLSLLKDSEGSVSHNFVFIILAVI